MKRIVFFRSGFLASLVLLVGGSVFAQTTSKLTNQTRLSSCMPTSKTYKTAGPLANAAGGPS